MKYSAHGNVVLAGARLVRNFTYAHRVARGDWKQRTHFGAIEPVDTPGGDFYAFFAPSRKSQHEITGRAKR